MISPSERPIVPASRFVVGIDLGTTNSALAYIDTGAEKETVAELLIPQVVQPGSVEARLAAGSHHALFETPVRGLELLDRKGSGGKPPGTPGHRPDRAGVVRRRGPRADCRGGP